MEHPPAASNSGGIRKIASRQVLEAARTMQAVVGEGENLLGESRIYAAVPSRALDGEGLLASVSIDRKQIVHDNFLRLRDELLVLALTLVAGLGGAWFIGRRFIVQPALRILGAANRLERGQLEARVPMHGSSQALEFARIASAFNLMADSLQVRQLNLEAELERSRDAYAVLDLILNSLQDGVIAVNGKGERLMANQAAGRVFIQEDKPQPPQQWARHLGIYDARGGALLETHELPLVRAMRGETGQMQMFVRNPLVPGGRMLQCRYQPMRGEGGVRGGLLVFTDITELQRLETEQALQLERLHDAQRRLLEAQHIGRIGNWEMQPQTGRVWWSDEVYALFGLKKSEFDGTLQGFLRHVHPDDRPPLEPIRESAVEDGGVMNVEYRIVKPDGSIAWMHEIGQVQHDGGQLAYFAGVVQDITARKQGEDALIQRELELSDYTGMLQRAAGAAQVITGEQSVERTLEMVAEQARFVIGAHMGVVSLTVDGDWAQGEDGLSLSDKYKALDASGGMLAPPDASAISSLVCETNRPLRLTQAELEQHPRWRSTGGQQPGQPPIRGLLAVPLVGRDGSNIGVLQLSDRNEGEFTERDEYVALQLAQLASTAIENARLFTQILELNATLEGRIAKRTGELARQEARYRTLAEQAPEVIWNLDRSGSVTFMNRAWCELVGGTPDEWLGDRWRQRIHPDDVPVMAKNWERSRETLMPYTGTRRVLGREGRWHTMSYRAAPVLDEGGAVAFWVGIDSDITELKSIEQALRSSNQELQTFSYSVSHDLRTPLGVIGGFSRALEHRLGDITDEKLKHFLTRIQAGVLKMEQLIDAMLSLAKVARAPLDYGPVDLSALARETLEGLQMQAPERKVNIRVQEGLGARGDQRLLRVVMDNLLGNAWKFSSQREEAVIEVGTKGGGVFFVRDNGAGFDMAYANKLFGDFQRLHSDSEFPGTGIGLATVRRIIARHQGRVWAESELGRGTTFYFSLSDSAPPAWLAGEEDPPPV